MLFFLPLNFVSNYISFLINNFIINVDEAVKLLRSNYFVHTRWFLIGSTYSFFSHSKGYILPVPALTIEIRELSYAKMMGRTGILS